MKDKRFDDIVAAKLNSYDSDIPAGMWERIHQHRKKRRLFAWWWTGAGIAAGIAIFYLLATDDQSRETITARLKPKNCSTEAS